MGVKAYNYATGRWDTLRVKVHSGKLLAGVPGVARHLGPGGTLEVRVEATQNGVEVYGGFPTLSALPAASSGAGDSNRAVADTRYRIGPARPGPARLCTGRPCTEPALHRPALHRGHERYADVPRGFRGGGGAGGNRAPQAHRGPGRGSPRHHRSPAGGRARAPGRSARAGQDLPRPCPRAVLDLGFSRIQFTPDLMPADITGTTLIQEDEGGRRFHFQPGPVFANLVLADEVNRATPKVQSALLEAMQERTVTVGGATRPLPNPFFVLATQNPIELEGTYPLPEAQLDRFLFKLSVPYPSDAELAEIARRTTGTAQPGLAAVVDAAHGAGHVGTGEDRAAGRPRARLRRAGW